jgi:nicotinamide-nucleotide amidase
VPGASDVLIEGAVTYTEDAKHRLGVHKKTLREHGAVSSQTAEEMARGIKKTGGAAITVAVTGVAGPTGGTPDTPVGTVWLAVAMGEEARSWRLQIPGDRELVKWRASRAALNAIRLAAMYGKLPETIAQWMTPP